MQKTENLEKEILEIKVLPKLRFREFNDSWNEMKLNDFTKIQRGKFTPRPRNNPIYYGGNIPFVQTSDVVKSKGKIFKYSQTLNEKGLKVSKKFKKGTILITVAANIGFSGVLEIDVACPDSLIGITCNEHNYNFFLQYLIEIEQPKMDYLAVAAAQKNINLEFLYPYKFILPTLKEQKKIASFLTVVDEKLLQLTKKKELLEDYKKGVMQKIFSQEIRFKDDNGNNYPNWEEKKLGQIGKTFNGLTGKTKEDFGNGKPFIQYMQVFSSAKIDTLKFGFVNLNEGEKQNKVRYGDVFFTTSSETPLEIGYASVLTEEIEELYLNSFCFGYRANSLNEFYPDFASYLFRSQSLRKQIVKLAQGSTRYNMSKVQFMKILIKLPTLKEQKKIANFLCAIDNKIESVSAQIEKTKEFKKGLLQQMFV